MVVHAVCKESREDIAVPFKKKNTSDIYFLVSRNYNKRMRHTEGVAEGERAQTYQNMSLVAEILFD